MTLGVTVGLLAAYSRGKLDDLLMRTMDVFLSLPQIVFALVLAATVGPKLWLLVLAVGSRRCLGQHASREVPPPRSWSGTSCGPPRRSASHGAGSCSPSAPERLEPAHRRDDAAHVVQRRGRRGLSFLGFGLQPPAADWGLMINENQNGLTLQPWPVLLPVIAIALLTIGTSLVGDGLARAAIGIERGTTGGE